MSRHRDSLTIRQALRHASAPDVLLTQLNVYTEEKFEDEEDLKERVKVMLNTYSQDKDTYSPEFRQAVNIIYQRSHDNFSLASLTMLGYYGRLLERELDQSVARASLLSTMTVCFSNFKLKLLQLVNAFFEQIVSLNDLSVSRPFDTFT